MPHRFLFVTLFMFTTFLLTSCSLNPFNYHGDIAEGNLYDAEQLAQLYIGMSKLEARRILGMPLLDDIFNNNNDYYLYRYFSGKTKQYYGKNLILHYDENQRLTRISNN